mgnify:FL=1
MHLLLAVHDLTHHRLRVHRPPHPPVDALLESRSLLLHDLVHYAVEASPPIAHGFYGRLFAGAQPEALREGTEAWEDLLAVEGRVARLQTAFKRGLATDDLALPRLRALWGAWRKVGRGQALRLAWPPGDPEVVDAP